MASVLVVEDNPDHRELLREHLTRAGHTVHLATTAAEGLRFARQHSPDLVLLDILLPDKPGTSVCRALKQSETTEDIAVIIVSGRGDEIDRIIGFELGADDYLVKPFSVRELLLRIEAVMRRHPRSSQPSRIVQFGCLRLDREAHRAWVDRDEIALTALEFRALVALLDRQGRVQTRSELLTAVWADENDNDARTVDTLVNRLRTKLGPAGKYIETVRGAGYRFSEHPQL